MVIIAIVLPISVVATFCLMYFMVKRGAVEAQAGVTGKLAPSVEVAIAPKISGKISKVHVKLGQRVQAGAVLFPNEKKAQKGEVRAGAQTSDAVEIVEGVQEGDQVVVRGQTLLRDGATVQIQQGS